MEPVIVEGRNYNPTNPPTWKEFSIDLVYVDHAYQQPLDEKWVSYLVDNWDGNAAGSLLISVHADGKAATPDGQHRIAAMRRLGIRYWQCECHYGLSLEQEADLFLSRNHKKVPHVIAKFRARVAKKEKTALEIKEIMKRYDVQIGFRDSNIDSPYYNCVDYIEKAYHYGLLEEVMQVIELCWSTHGRLARDRIVVAGVTLFLRNFIEHRAFNLDSAIDRISVRIDLKRAKTHARDAAGAGGTSQAYQFAKLLWEAYNKGRQTQRLPEITVYR
jgi:hypothetical protein